MRIINDDFPDSIEKFFPLKGKRFLEIGCGAGIYSVQLAERCRTLFAIDPLQQSVKRARRLNNRNNIFYDVGSAENLRFKEGFFDAVIFTLSLHHIGRLNIKAAIDNAIKVTKMNGCVIFVEPCFEGSFFEAELLFDACDGDERLEKAEAYSKMLSHPGLKEISEFYIVTSFIFSSAHNFVTKLKAKKNLHEVRQFLEKHHYCLRAPRRINIFALRQRRSKGK